MKKFLYKLIHFIYEYNRYSQLKTFGLKETKNDIEGIEFTHFQNNSGSRVLVLLHGLLDSSFGFRRIIPHLDSSWNLYVPDLPGFGKNMLPEISYLYHLDIFSTIVYDWIKVLNLRDIILVGHSMGGLISQHIALLDSKKDRRINKILLIAPGSSPHPDRDTIKAILFPQNRAEVLRLLHELYYKDFPEPSPIIQDTLVSIWNSKGLEFLTKNTIAREKEIFFGDRASEIQIPTYILAGREDKITDMEMMNNLNSWIPNSTLEFIENAKHALHLEHPKLVADFINRRGI